MKTKDVLIVLVLGAIAWIAYKFFNQPKPAATSPTASTGTAGLLSLLFGQAKNGSPTTNQINGNPNYSQLINSGTGLVKSLGQLFGSGTTTANSGVSNPINNDPGNYLTSPTLYNENILPQNTDNAFNNLDQTNTTFFGNLDPSLLSLKKPAFKAPKIGKVRK